MRYLNTQTGLVLALGSLALWAGAVLFVGPKDAKADPNTETFEVWVGSNCPDGNNHVSAFLSDPALDGCKDNHKREITVQVR